MDKATLRRALAGVVPADRARADRAICRGVLAHPAFCKARTVYLFAPIGDEPDIAPLLPAALAQGKQVALPVVQGEDMRFVSVTPSTRLVRGKYGILVPDTPHSEPLPPDMILVPMVSFDAGCNRLGHGKGYYDRFLSALDGRGYRLGVCYAMRASDSVFAAPWDVGCDEVMTEEGSVYAHHRREI